MTGPIQRHEEPEGLPGAVHPGQAQPSDRQLFSEPDKGVRQAPVKQTAGDSPAATEEMLEEEDELERGTWDPQSRYSRWEGRAEPGGRSDGRRGFSPRAQAEPVPDRGGCAVSSRPACLHPGRPGPSWTPFLSQDVLPLSVRERTRGAGRRQDCGSLSWRPGCWRRSLSIAPALKCIISTAFDLPAGEGTQVR